MSDGFFFVIGDDDARVFGPWSHEDLGIGLRRVVVVES